MRTDIAARLRRALADDDAELSEIVEAMTDALLQSLSPDNALRFERILTNFARAAEELGPDASVADIDRRYREIAARPN